MSAAGRSAWSVIARAVCGVAALALLVAGITLLRSCAGSVARSFDVEGHRGARGELPENTLSAFTLADDLGVTTLEMDTNVTADGVLVVTHDSILNPDLVRDASGQWVGQDIAVNSLTLAEVKKLDVGRLRPGSAYAQRFPTQEPIDGARIPTLKEVLVAFRDRSDVRFNIETKIEPTHPERSPDPARFARMLVDEIRAGGVEKRTMIQSFDWRTLREVQRIAPDITTVALTEADPGLLADGLWTAGLRLGDVKGSVPALVAALGADVWSPDCDGLTAEAVRDAHDRGLAVVPWTVNEPADLDSVIALGVDGVISDYPDRALAAAPEARGNRIPIILVVAGALLGALAILPPVLSRFRERR